MVWFLVLVAFGYILWREVLSKASVNSEVALYQEYRRLIKAAAKKGERHVYVWHTPFQLDRFPDVRRQLELDGFINSNDSQCPFFVILSWNSRSEGEAKVIYEYMKASKVTNAVDELARLNQKFKGNA